MKPTTLNVFGRTYRVVYRTFDEDIYGECKNKQALIEIDESLTGRDLIHTIIHESIHAIFHRLSYSQAIHHDLEELLSDTIATFLVDNDLVKVTKSEHEI